jgi:hypothetical protein
MTETQVQTEEPPTPAQTADRRYRNRYTLCFAVSQRLGPVRMLTKRFEIFGGREGIRTPGLLVANEALSQLSYSPTSSRQILAEGNGLANRVRHGSNAGASKNQTGRTWVRPVVPQYFCVNAYG